MSYNKMIEYVLNMMFNMYPAVKKDFERNKRFFLNGVNFVFNISHNCYVRKKESKKFIKIQLSVIGVLIILCYLFSGNIWLSLSISLFIGKNLEFFYYEEYKFIIYYILTKVLYRVKIYSRFKMVFGYSIIVIAEDKTGCVHVGPAKKYAEKFEKEFEDIEYYIVPPHSLYRFIFDYVSCRFKYPNLGRVILEIIYNVNNVTSLKDEYNFK